MSKINYSIRYQYSFLNNSEKNIYKGIVEAILNFENCFVTNLVNAERLAEIFYIVCDDFPEFFYLDKRVNYTYAMHYSKIFFSYTSGKSKILSMILNLKKNIDPIIVKASNFQNIFEKVLYVYDFLTENVKYDLELYELKNDNICGYTAYGALVNNLAVCSGYASAFQLLMNNLGFRCIKVVNDKHSWCCGEIKNKWYYFDPTWDAPLSDNINSCGIINHNYFAVKTSEILLDHDYPKTLNLPVCISNDFDYYINKNLYFTSVEEEDINRLLSLLQTAFPNAITIKFESSYLCNQAESKLFCKNKIWEVYSDKVSYIKNKKTLSIIPK